jgi:hypothetical protein
MKEHKDYKAICSFKNKAQKKEPTGSFFIFMHFINYPFKASAPPTISRISFVIAA